MTSLKNYIKFLSKSVKIFSYFGKIFDYGSLKFWILRKLKGMGSDKFRGEGSRESLRKKWKIGERLASQLRD